jgi:hypothetical protein
MFRERRIDPDPRDRRRIDVATVPAQTAPPDLSSVLDLDRHIIYVPVHRFVEPDTAHCLRACEDLGLRVDYAKGSSAIDCVRNIMATEAIQAEMESFIFVDADMLFSPEDLVGLLLRPEPVVAGIYAAKVVGKGQLNACFPPELKTIKLGSWATELTPIRRIGAGFLRIKTAALRLMIERLDLKLCRMSHTRGYPFFQPMIVDGDGEGDSEPFYLTEDYAFCHRCELAGIPTYADTSFRLYHVGEYAFGWEEAAGEYIPRSRNLEYDIFTHKPVTSRPE